MYLDCQVRIPETDGKITKKTIKGTVYIYYEYARVYLNWSRTAKKNGIRPKDLYRRL